MNVKDFRLNRLFHPESGKCFDLAIGHGLFNEPNFLKGIEDVVSTTHTIVEAGPDMIQLTPG